MYLKYVQIVNFKNLKNVRFEFSKGANTIIGENDSGKSNALTAIRILLDDNYYYNTKRLKETDFSYALGDWKGHWIIISAFFDEISNEDKHNEFCAEITPEQENIDFLKSYIRCTDKDFGTVSLFIRPCRTKRIELAEAAQNGTFEAVRSQIKLSDYEFYYTSRSQADFTDENVYKSIVGDICAGQYVNPEDDDQSVLGSKIDIMNVSTDALTRKLTDYTMWCNAINAVSTLTGMIRTEFGIRYQFTVCICHVSFPPLCFCREAVLIQL